MPFNSILMPYKQNCKIEGEIVTKLKIARLYFSSRKKQKEIAQNILCHGNTVNNIIKECKANLADKKDGEAWHYLKTNQKIPLEKLSLFNFFKHQSRKPKSNYRCLSGKNENLVLEKQSKLNYGPRRLFKYLKRQGYDMENIYTIAKIKGAYQRNKLQAKKIRTVNGERRPLYTYGEIEAFEYLQYDTKQIADQHSLPIEIYKKFKNSKKFPKYQWTIIDAKTKTRFLAWSHSLDSFFGLKFLEFVVCWLRAHNIRVKIHIQVDGGTEFCCGSKKKLKIWNEKLNKHNLEVYQTEGAKWKQNLVERSHRMDDEEFYCPRGEFIENKNDFLVEGQYWIVYQNQRGNEGIGLNGLSPKEKLEQLGIYNARQICNFPCLILEDFFMPFQLFFEPQKSQNVLTPYL